MILYYQDPNLLPCKQKKLPFVHGSVSLVSWSLLLWLPMLYPPLVWSSEVDFQRVEWMQWCGGNGKTNLDQIHTC